MIKNTKPIAQFMSAAPICVQHDAELATAVEMLEQHGVRHLPVLDGSKLVGIVSERDLAVVESLVPDEWERYLVGEAMTPEPYVVSPDTPLRDVARVMADHKYGCALVVETNGKLVGLFSTVDALRLLAGETVFGSADV
jgi:acetoin utilization protein AcuB